MAGDKRNKNHERIVRERELATYVHPMRIDEQWEC